VENFDEHADAAAEEFANLANCSVWCQLDEWALNFGLRSSSLASAYDRALERRGALVASEEGGFFPMLRTTLLALAAATALGVSVAGAAPVNGGVIGFAAYDNAPLQQVWWHRHHHWRWWRHHHRRWW
jgi:hypothetical protein